MNVEIQTAIQTAIESGAYGSGRFVSLQYKIEGSQKVTPNYLRQFPQFMGLKGECVDTSQVERFIGISGFSYLKIVENSLAILEQLQRFNMFDPIQNQAASELIDSFTRTLNGSSESTHEHAYTDCAEIPNGKIHVDTGNLHIALLVVKRTVIEERKFPRSVKVSSPLVAAKDKLRYALPIGKYRQFRLSPSGEWEMGISKTHKLSVIPDEFSIVKR